MGTLATQATSEPAQPPLKGLHAYVNVKAFFEIVLNLDSINFHFILTLFLLNSKKKIGFFGFLETHVRA